MTVVANYISPLLPFLLLLPVIVIGQDLNQVINSTETYKVFRIFPRDWRDVDSIAALRSMSEDSELDFWLDSRQPGQFADVMVSPRIQAAVRDWLMERNLRFRVTINDVAKLIYQHEHSHKSIIKNKYTNSEINEEVRKSEDEILQKIDRLRDAPIAEDAEGAKFGNRPFEFLRKVKGYNYPFGQYTNYATMLRFMRTIEFYYPHLAKLVRIGMTHEGRPIEGLKLGYHVTNNTKKVFWIDGNIHAREWASSHTALFIINQLVAGYGKDPLVTHYMNNLNFIVVPCLNPDGYEYSRSSMNPNIRLWRKNRSPEKCVSSKWGGTRCCQGVDLNRNFDFHWAESGSSTNPCSNLYAGEYAFSEPETKAVSDFLKQPEYRKKIDGFITLHTYAQLWIHPFSHEVEYYPNDIGRLTKVAQRAVNRLKDIYGTQFRIGTGADLLSPAAGGSDDWAKEVLEVKYVYLIELRPQLELSRGFILRQEELVPTAIETFEGIKVVIEQVLEDNGIKPRPKLPTKQYGATSDIVSRVHSAPVYRTHEKVSELIENKFVNGRFGRVQEIRPNPFVVVEEEKNEMGPTWVRANLNPASITGTSGLETGDSAVRTWETTTTKEQPTTPSFETEETTTSDFRREESTTSDFGREESTTSDFRREESTTSDFGREESTTSDFGTEETTISDFGTEESTTSDFGREESTTSDFGTEETTTSDFGREESTTVTSEYENPTTFEEQTTSTTATEATTTTEETTISATTLTTTEPTTTTTEFTTLTTTMESTTTEAGTTSTTTKMASTVSPSTPETMAKRLTQELLMKQLLRIQALKSLKASIEQRVPLSTPSPTIYQAPRFLTSGPLLKSTISMESIDLNSKKTTTPFVLPPLVPVSTPKPGNQLQYKPSVTCVDKKYSCTFWIKADKNVCQDQQRFMKLNCRKSCRFCD